MVCDPEQGAAVVEARGGQREGVCRPAELRTLQLNEAAIRDDSPRLASCERPPACL